MIAALFQALPALALAAAVVGVVVAEVRDTDPADWFESTPEGETR